MELRRRLGCLFSRRFDPPFRFALTRAEVEKAAENQAPTIIVTDQCCAKKWVNPLRKLTGSIRRARITNFRFAILARTHHPKPHRPTPTLHFAVALKRRVESDLVDRLALGGHWCTLQAPTADVS
jgi:hypothetical protein